MVPGRHTGRTSLFADFIIYFILCYIDISGGSLSAPLILINLKGEINSMILYNPTNKEGNPTKVILTTVKASRRDSDTIIGPGQALDVSIIMSDDRIKQNPEIIQHLKAGTLKIVDTSLLKSSFEEIAEAATIKQVPPEKEVKEIFKDATIQPQENPDAQKAEDTVSPAPPSTSPEQETVVPQPKDNKPDGFISNKDLELQTEMLDTDEVSSSAKKAKRADLPGKKFDGQKQNILDEIAETSSLSRLEDYAEMYVKDPDIVAACEDRLEDIEGDEIEAPELDGQANAIIE